MALTSNIIGEIGENTAALRLSKYGIFKVYFLGDKAPIEDFLLEVIDDIHPYHCMIQVKATSQVDKYAPDGSMKTPVNAEKLKELTKRPLPTYVAGVDIDDEIIFIAPAFDGNIRYNTIPPKLRIDNTNPGRSKADLVKLKEDIINYWECIDINKCKQSYQSLL